MKKVAYIASECVPFIKTGGLADVVGALPKSFNRNEFDVRIIIPKYQCIPKQYKNNMKYISSFYMDIGERSIYVGIMYMEYEGVSIYFVDNEFYFNGDSPYGDTKWDIEKFSFFSKAALSILPVIGFKPDYVHCHDWQAGLVPVYLKTMFSANPFFSGMKSIMTIHNLQFQGKWDIEHLKYCSGLPDYLFTPDKLEIHKNASMLKGGLVYADLITTVSTTYSYEIQTPYYGEGLDGLLQARNQSLVGIVNGIDYDIYNPNTDALLYKNYNVKNFKKNKVVNKMSLQKELGLPVDKKQFVIGIISRLTEQKGLDLVDYVMNDICQDGVQFIVLGTGNPRYENMFRYYQGLHPTKVSANIYFSDALSHKIYGGCDAILVPSRFEPCGLTQLMALRYGCLPIVRESGGLKDTVIPYNEYEQIGTGFSFANYDARELLHTINYAKEVFYHQKKNWESMQVRAMEMDYSWNNSAIHYEELYK